MFSVKGRPHYHSPKKEEYAHIKFDLDAGEFSAHLVAKSFILTWAIHRLFVPV